MKLKAKQFSIFLAVGISVALGGGCHTETSVKTAKAHPPASAPAPSPAPVSATPRSQDQKPPQAQIGILPFPRPRPSNAWLLTAPPLSVEDLIARVKAHYGAGVKQFQAGNPAGERDEFNKALNEILKSGINVDSDPRLAEIFDQMADTMERDQQEAPLAAQPEGEEESTEEVAGEPAAIEEIASLPSLPKGDPRLAQMAEQELINVPHDLPLTVNASVLQYLSFFQTPRGREIVETGLRRSGRYSDMIRRTLREEGLPQDLIYVAQAESAFLPQSVSRAGARGIWQFMPFRGEQYDLRRTWFVDERSDPGKSTRAAARHLKDLYQMFGDWYLVMAAYNSGPGNVERGIERTGYADFWELEKRNVLPAQTKDYVPIILALALVAKDPGRYGVQAAPERPAGVEFVKAGHSIDLRLVSDATDVGLEDLRQVNPELLRMVTPDDPNYELRLPAGTADKFRAAIAEIPQEKWTSWRLHKVESGDTLAGIARQYRVTVAALEEANSEDVRAHLEPSVKVIVPAAPSSQVKLVHYRVRRGDTLEGIAGRFNVTVRELKRWNGLRGSRAPRGWRLRIYAGGITPALLRQPKSKRAEGKESVTSASTQHGPVRYRVKAGETLYSIARRYGISVKEIQRENPFLADRALEAGDTLTIAPQN